MSVSVGTNEQRIKAFHLSNKKKQGLKYLNTKRIKTHRRPCCADLCMRMDLPLDKKQWKIRTGPLGHWATGPPGGGGWRVAGHWATGSWRWRAVGPPGRRPWAAILLLPKPIKSGFPQIWTKLWHKSKNRFCLYFDHR